eukprot:778171-Rhodomonas_salina.1
MCLALAALAARSQRDQCREQLRAVPRVSTARTTLQYRSGTARTADHRSERVERAKEESGENWRENSESSRGENTEWEGERTRHGEEENTARERERERERDQQQAVREREREKESERKRGSCLLYTSPSPRDRG